jgi:D-alanine-D-alanine ligase
MKTVAVIFGGRSTEHDVSIVTAIASIIKPLELTKEYKVEPIYIARDGAWYWDPKLKDIHLFTSGEIDDFISRSHPVSVQFDGGMTLVKSSGIAGRKQLKQIDIVFPAMHGTYGEDGDLMGLLEMAGVAYVGCGVAASAIAMDKVLAKQLAVGCGIATSKFLAFTKADLERDAAVHLKKIAKELRFPLFVKPAHLGSSIGISRVSSEQELGNALEVAAHYDDSVIVEEAVTNLIEVTLPIMGSTDDPKPALLEQPMTKPEDFFDFETKYMSGGKKGGGKKGGGIKGSQGYSQIPADLPKDLYAKAEAVGLGVYKALGCSGIARIDMLIDSKSGEVYFNEANPLPGSLYAHNWAAAGISSVMLVQKLVTIAEDRFRQQKQLTTSFGTNFLKQF